MLFSVLSIIAYCVALLWITPTLANIENQNSNKKPNIKAVFSIGLVAVLCHFISTSQEFHACQC